MRLELGSRVDCTDESFGKLADVVIDPTSRRVTHLVVEHDRDPCADERRDPTLICVVEEAVEPKLATGAGPMEARLAGERVPGGHVSA